MAETAAGVLYRQQSIEIFRQNQSRLRKTVTTEANVSVPQGGGSGSAVFLVAGSATSAPTTRGTNGRIPATAATLAQSTATLVEWHSVQEATRFNIETSQGKQVQIMQRDTLAAMNRKIDSEILTELGQTTVDTGAAVTASLHLVSYALTILGVNDVENDGDIHAVISPGFLGYLHSVKEFTNMQYVKDAKLDKALPNEFNWMGVHFMVSTRISGIGGAAEKCFMYHKNAIGHACDMEQVTVDSGYNARHDFSWSRASSFMGSKMLQGTGIVQMNHNAADFAAQ